MAENTSTFTGAAADGTALTAVYLTQPAANVAIGLVFAGSDLPHIVHWGRPLAKPDTLLAAYDALKPQRVSARSTTPLGRLSCPPRPKAGSASSAWCCAAPASSSSPSSP